MLRDAGVRGIDVRRVTSSSELRSFGRIRVTENIESLGRGWLLGNYMWEYNDGGGWGGCDVKENRPTVLLDTSLLMTYRDQEGRYVVSPGSHKGPTAFRGSYMTAYHDVHRLAGRQPA